MGFWKADDPRCATDAAWRCCWNRRRDTARHGMTRRTGGDQHGLVTEVCKRSRRVHQKPGGYSNDQAIKPVLVSVLVLLLRATCYLSTCLCSGWTLRAGKDANVGGKRPLFPVASLGQPGSTERTAEMDHCEGRLPREARVRALEPRCSPGEDRGP